MRRKGGESVFPETVSTKTVWESWVTRKDHLGSHYSPLPPNFLFSPYFWGRDLELAGAG